MEEKETQLTLRIYGKQFLNGERVFLPLQEIPLLRHIKLSEIERLRLELVTSELLDTSPSSICSTVLPAIDVSLSLHTQ